MLSKTRKSSPIRIAGGAIGVGALSLAALGLTASGTQAAETIKVRVEAATGLDLAGALGGQDAPPPPQDAPPPPKAPKAGAAPVAPAAPDAPKGERRIYRVVTHRDGDDHGAHGKGPHRVMIVNGERIEMPDIPDTAEIMAMVPDVESGNCKEGKPHDMVVEHPAKPGKRQRIVICTNRIEAQAGEARRIAMRHRGMGMRHALIGLEHARTTIENDTTLSADEKAKALKGIDEAIREIRKASKDD